LTPPASRASINGTIVLTDAKEKAAFVAKRRFAAQSLPGAAAIFVRSASQLRAASLRCRYRGKARREQNTEAQRAQ
jgi:hypothetical protein